MSAVGQGDLADRVARLEARVRWWRVAGSGALVSLAFFAWVVGDLSTTVRAIGRKVETRRVVLVDQAGVERAWLGLAEDGTPHLEFYDAAGADLASIAVQADGTVRMEGIEAHTFRSAPR